MKTVNQQFSGGVQCYTRAVYSQGSVRQRAYQICMRMCWSLSSWHRRQKSTKPHPLSKFSQRNVDTPPHPGWKTRKRGVNGPTNHWQVYDNYPVLHDILHGFLKNKKRSKCTIVLTFWDQNPVTRSNYISETWPYTFLLCHLYHLSHKCTIIWAETQNQSNVWRRS